MLEDTIQLHRSRDIPFSLVLVDIDHFKGINDDFGHQHGDQVLRQFRRHAPRDCPRRGAVLPLRRRGVRDAPAGVRQEGGHAGRAAVSARRFKGATGRTASVTASFGVATYTGETMSGHELVENADAGSLRVQALPGRDRRDPLRRTYAGDPRYRLDVR